MALDRNIYAALEAVVGGANISQDPGVMLGYAYNAFSFVNPEECGKFTPVRPAAVLLPDSTEQVQAIVRLCNTHKIKFKAHSTGWGPWGLANAPDQILMDLRRMNRIIDIDEKNMFAVIEPCVIAGQLQAEAMKRGLDCNIVAAGAGHSPLASATSFQGMGNKGLTTSTNERNLLGVEWVLPNGELLRLGAPAMGAGWFSGDGPGPGLRGIMRGFIGAAGGLGVFTKIGFKLYPWAGERTPRSTGTAPQYGMAIPDNSAFYLPYWDDWERMAEASYRIGEAGVAYCVTRVPIDCLNAYLTATNNEFYDLLQSDALPFKDEHRRLWCSVVSGHSAREFAYKRQVFEQIVADTRGRFLELSPAQQELLYAATIRVCYLPRVFRATGDISTSFGIEESVGLLARTTRIGEQVRGEYVKQGSFVDDGREGFWGWLYEGGRSLHWENAYHLDPTDIESRRASREYMMAASQAVVKESVGMVMLPSLFGPFADLLGPMYGNPQHLMRKIKNSFDPDNLSDSVFAVPPEPQASPEPLDKAADPDAKR